MLGSRGDAERDREVETACFNLFSARPPRYWENETHNETLVDPVRNVTMRELLALAVYDAGSPTAKPAMNAFAEAATAARTEATAKKRIVMVLL